MMRRPFGKWFIGRHTAAGLWDPEPTAWEVKDPTPLLDAARDDMQALASVTAQPGPPENLDRILAVLRRGHRYVEDTWYSCPQEPSEGCANDAVDTACNCGYYERHMAADLLERAYGLGVDSTTD